MFALPAGGVSGVLTSQFGPVIVRVKSITPSTVKPYSEVADDIKRKISAARAGDKIQTLHDKIEDLRVSGKPLGEAAKEAGLTAQSVAAVDAKGRDPSGKDVGLPDSAELLKAVFASDVGLDEAPIQTKDRGFVWFAVTKIDPSHDRTFEEAKSEVEAEWRAEQVDKALAAKADDLVKELRHGDEHRRRREERERDRRARRRHPPRRDHEPAASVVEAIFREPADGAGSAAAPGGRWVFKITADKTPPLDPSIRAPNRLSISSIARRPKRLLDQYVVALRQSLGVTVNQSALQSAEGG